MYSKKYNLGEFRVRILQLLERYSSNGKKNTLGEVEDIQLKLISSLNINFNKLWYEFPDTRLQTDISFLNPESVLELENIRICSGEPVTQRFNVEKPAFSLTVSGTGILLFQVASMQQVYSIETAPGTYTVINGYIDTMAGRDVSFSLEADTCLDVKSFIIYENIESSVGEYMLLCDKSRVAAFLPSDCSKILYLQRDNDNINYAEYCEIDEKNHIVKIPKKFCSDYVLGYIPYPPCIALDAHDSTVIDISPVMFDALCYMCAAELCPANDSELYSRLIYKCREILENIYDRQRGCRIKNSFYGLVRRTGTALKKYGR